MAGGKIIGIDLGTTNSKVAIWEGNEPVVIANSEGSHLTPSVVSFEASGETKVGIAAKRQAVMNPKNTVYSIKRFMGRRRSEVADDEKIVPYKLAGSPDEHVRVDVVGKLYSPQEISAMILRKVREAAEAYLGQPVSRAVITVPAYFNDSQRQATKDAGTIAGFSVERIINEPTAAALAYGLGKKKNQKIAVFDLGGGTFDISILDVGEAEDGKTFEVVSTSGDTHLGGDDYDQALIAYLADEFKKAHGIDLRRDPMALQRLKEACEKAKIELSSGTETEVNLPFITADQGGPKHLQLKITRAKFEQITDPITQRMRLPCERALSDAKLKPREIEEVILVGGATRMPRVQQMARDIFGKEPNKSVNPDEAVCLGAAIQGGVLTREVRDVLLLDVTPLSLGIETKGGIMTRLVERNTTIPVTKKQVFSTASDNQPGVEIHVLQGERDMAADNRTLARFQLQGIPPAPMGVPQIEVSFTLDANGILNVAAKDLGTGREQSIRVESSSGLRKDEVEKMRKEGEAHAEDDKKKRQLAEARNAAEQLLYKTEGDLKEYGGRVSEAERKKIEEAREKLKNAREGGDLAALQAATDELNKATYALGEAIYREAAKSRGGTSGGPEPGPSGGGGGGKGGKSGEDIRDAEFKVKD
ncbi:MAG: molecular chaperone DnaK [Planctomycetales bacterium]|nr:molecular chaperone DnaK [Planctomycetales bacterium]